MCRWTTRRNFGSIPSRSSLTGTSQCSTSIRCRSLEALQKGGVQHIYTGNLTTGEHGLKVLIIGKTKGGSDLRETKSFKFSKDEKPKVLEKPRLLTAAVHHNFAGVEHEVRQNFLQLVRIGQISGSRCSPDQLHLHPVRFQAVPQQYQGHIYHIGRTDLLHLQLGRPGELQEVPHNRVNMPDLLGNDLEIFLLGRRHRQGTFQRKEPHVHRRQGIADAVGHPRRQLSHHGPLPRLQQMFLAARKLPSEPGPRPR